MKETVVLLTSCIDPGTMRDVSRRDINLRLEDYTNAILDWSRKKSFSRIVFCDNSGYDLGRLSSLPKKNGSFSEWEFLSLDGNRQKELGKGSGEIEIIDYVINNSKLITDDCLVLKVTGRLVLRNSCSMLSLLNNSANSVKIFCDLRGNLQWADSRVFASSKCFLVDYLLPLREKINDTLGINFEHVLARATHAAMSNGLEWSMLPETPRIIGVSGTSGVRYPQGHISYWRRELFRQVKTWCIERAA